MLTVFEKHGRACIRPQSARLTWSGVVSTDSGYNSRGQSARFCRDSDPILKAILARFWMRIVPESRGRIDHPIRPADSWRDSSLRHGHPCCIPTVCFQPVAYVFCQNKYNPVVFAYQLHLLDLVHTFRMDKNECNLSTASLIRLLQWSCTRKRQLT